MSRRLYAILTQQLIADSHQRIDAQKFGKQWVVTCEAMQREYGPPEL